jgi:hypothetical protein
LKSHRGASYFVFFHKYRYADQIVENGVGRAWVRGEKCTRFCWEITWKIVRSEVRGIDEKIGSKWILGRFAKGFIVDSVGSV